MKKSNNIISDWLDKHGDPEIRKKVEEEAINIGIENTNMSLEKLFNNISDYIDYECEYHFSKDNQGNYFYDVIIFKEGYYIDEASDTNLKNLLLKTLNKLQHNNTPDNIPKNNL